MTRTTAIDLTPPVEKAFLVAVDTGDDAGWTAEESLTELASLAATAGADVVGAEWQNRRHVDPNWYVGKGKAEELLHAKSETGFTILVADDELSPAQQKALTDVGLDPDTRFRYPHEFSGGQRQRIAVARAVVLEPTFVVLDEPTSALDMLIQAQIVELLRALQKRRNLTYMFISHDLRVVAALASRLVVMRHGKVVEEGPAAALFAQPRSDYTRALFAAAFNLETAPEGGVAE